MNFWSQMNESFLDQFCEKMNETEINEIFKKPMSIQNQINEKIKQL